MSYKPYRGSGIIQDKLMRKAQYHRNEVVNMIESNEYLSFENLNRFSKHIYLHYLNEKKLNTPCSIEYSSVRPYFLNLLIKYIDKTYKPFQELMKKQNRL